MLRSLSPQCAAVAATWVTCAKLQAVRCPAFSSRHHPGSLASAQRRGIFSCEVARKAEKITESLQQSWGPVAAALKGQGGEVDVKALVEALKDGQASILGALLGQDKDVDIERLLGALRDHHARQSSTKAIFEQHFEADPMAVVRCIQRELEAIRGGLMKHFGNVELATLHPLAVFYCVSERSRERTPDLKEARLLARGEGAAHPDLSWDSDLFAGLLEHCALADCAYEKTAAEAQRLLGDLWSGYSWEMPVCVTESLPGRPAHLLAVRHRSDEGGAKPRVVLAVRGTKALADAVTDAMVDSAPFEGGAAHAGVARAAESLCESYAGILSSFEQKGYEVVVVGHSLGAATAAAVTLKLRRTHNLQTARCVCFAPPPTVSAALAEECAPYIMSVVHDDDFIPRSQVSSLLKLYREILEYDWLPAAREDARKFFAAAPRWIKESQVHDEIFGRVHSVLEHHATAWNKSRLAAIKSIDSCDISATASPLLQLPGFVVHLVRCKGGYRAVRARADWLEALELSDTMIQDHFLDSHLEALQQLVDAGSQGHHDVLQRYLPNNAPPELQESVASLARNTNRLRSKVAALLRARPDV